MGWQSRREAVVGSIVIAAVLLGLSGLVLVGWTEAVAPPWRAAHGQGVHGTWTPTSVSGSKGGPIWLGDFVPDGGGPVQRDVSYSQPGVAVREGVPVAAVEVGTQVYAVDDTSAWVFPAVVASLFTLLLAGMCWFVGRHLRPRRG
ncbi:hypothetical protein Cs7R123_26870 [Catellatospora sp. TT07R-123]|nr:hypothetical protein Cs7R123_26870 [Catellatospora sp. TT07R-123]